MKEIDSALLDASLQRKILNELAQKTPPGVIASELRAADGINPDKMFCNIRYLELNGYMVLERLHCIGSNRTLAQDLILRITLEGQHFLYKSRPIPEAPQP